MSHHKIDRVRSNPHECQSNRLMKYYPDRHNGIRTMCALLMFGLALTACTRTWVPVETRVVPSPSASVETPERSTPTPYEETSAMTYAVVWVEAEETLVVTKPAGISGTAVDELAHGQRGIQLTGGSTQLGSSTWVEIYVPGGGIGWVNAWYLTENVSTSDFCQDTRVNALLEDFKQALVDEDGELLASLVNPERGLTLRHDWWNPEVLIAPDMVHGLFSDLSEVDWGVLSGSQFPVRGSFGQIIVTQLKDVFEISPETACNQLIIGVTSRPAIWPEGFNNMNFYSFHRPSPEGGNQFDWRTWTIGIEYVDGQPYLSVMIQYRGDI